MAGAERVGLTVARRHGNGARSREVPAVTLPVETALPHLVAARHHPAAHPATAGWGAAALHALHLAARGRLLPGLTADDLDAWRAGPLDADDIAHLRAVAAALPAEAYAVPVPGRGPLRLPDPETLVRAFLDAVADALPRTPAAAHAVGRRSRPAPRSTCPARAWPPRRRPEWTPGSASRSASTCRRTNSSTSAPPAKGARKRAAASGTPPPRSSRSTASPTPPSSSTPRTCGRGGRALRPPRPDRRRLALRRAARVWPPLARLLERDVPDVLAVTEDELYELLGPAAARLADAGVAVHWPRELARSLSASAVVRPALAAPGSATDGTSFFDSEELLRFDWQLALDGDPLTEREMDLLAEAHRPVVRLRDQWVVVDPDLVRKARKRELGLLEPVDALGVALTGTAEVDGETVPAVPVGALAALRDRLLAGPEDVQAPPGLTATLRDYQLRGLAWLDLMTSLGLGGCLADDMGLGKTVTLIALHLRRARRAPTLVVCPASLLGNWQREVRKFAPDVPVRRFHGADRDLDGTGAASSSPPTGPCAPAPPDWPRTSGGWSSPTRRSTSRTRSPRPPGRCARSPRPPGSP